MPILSQPAFGPRTALAYITVGALLDVWTTVWYFAFIQGAEHPSNTTWFFLVGLFLTGITLIALGLALGPIGQAARRAELPPPEAVPAEAAVQQVAAANPPAVAAAPGAIPPGYVPAPAAGVPPVAPPSVPVRSA